jgi:hypothetical protein
MKKNNFVVVLVLLIASIFLLWLWFAKQFNLVDNPVDITLSIIWWVLMVVVAAVFVLTEKRRRAAIRTVYVGAAGVYNPQAGLVSAPALADKMTALAEMLEGLEYGWEAKELKDEQMQVDCVVRSAKFSDGGNTWEGEVEFAGAQSGRTHKFSSKEELAFLLK